MYFKHNAMKINFWLGSMMSSHAVTQIPGKSLCFETIIILIQGDNVWYKTHHV